jgi:hypothetical protein
LKQEKVKPFFTETKEEISLSGRRFIDLLQAVLEKRAAFRFQAKGFSMSPFIKDSDIVTISPLNNGSVGLGQTLAFVHPGNGRLAIHRVIGRSKDRYLLKGDNIFAVDGLVKHEYILGVVSCVRRNGKAFTLGLGWEKVIIAFCSRIKLFPLILGGWRWGKRLWHRQK